jgi:hypothetical protein
MGVERARRGPSINHMDRPANTGSAVIVQMLTGDVLIFLLFFAGLILYFLAWVRERLPK